MEGLKLDHFKKIHEDEHQAILQHPKGHKITIAKNALSEKIRGQLKAIPMYNAGQVPDSQDGTPILPERDIASDPSFSPALLQAVNSTPNALDLSGQPIKAPEVSAAPQVPAPEQKSGEEGEGILSTIGGFLRGDFHNPDVQPGTNPVLNKFSANPKSAKEIIEEGKASKPVEPNKTAAETPSNYNLGVIPASNSGTSVAGNPLFAANAAATDAYLAGLKKRIGGAEQAAELTGQQGEQQAGIYDEQVKQQQQLAYDTKSHYDSMTGEIDNLKHDIDNNHINPSQYLDSMSTGGKISTAIGMLVAGLGSGLTGGENPVVKYLNNQIDRNIDAQKNDLGKKNNLLSALLHQQGNLSTATSMMQSLYKNMYADKLSQAASKFAGPQAQAAAQQLAGQWKQEAAQTIGNAAQTKALMNMNNTGGSQQMDPSLLIRAIVPKERQEDAYKELKAQQNINTINKNAMGDFDHASSLQNIGSRILSPIQSTAQINSVWNPMIDKITKQNEGRVTPITVDMINAFKPAVTDNTETRQIKRNSLYQLLNGERATPVLDSFRIPVNKNIGLAQRNNQVGANYATLGSGKKGSIAQK